MPAKTQDSTVEKRFFDQISAEHQGGYFSPKGWKRLVELIAHFLPRRERVRILDVGCGTGQLIFHLRQILPEADLVGVDISEASVRRARDLGIGTFIVGDISTLDLTPELGRFDLVMLSSVVHHFTDPRVPISCAKRHLAEDGRILSYDPNVYNPFFALYRNPKSPFYSQVGISPNERLMSDKELSQAYTDEGLEVDTFGLSGIRFAWIQSRFARLILPLFNFLDELFFKNTCLEERFGCFRICVTKQAGSASDPKCLACLSPELRRLYFLAPYTWYRCHQCGTVFSNPIRDIDEPYSFYHTEWDSDLYQKYYAGLRAKQSNEILDWLEAHGRIELDILDVGCGYGFFVQEAVKRGHRAEGIDVSLPDESYLCVPELLRRLPLQEKVQEQERYDVVVALNVLEHIGKPEPFLKQIKRTVREGGIVVLSIPMIEGPIYRFSHLLFRATLGMCRGAWLTLLQWGSSSPHVFLPSSKGLKALLRLSLRPDRFWVIRQPIADLGALHERVQMEGKRSGQGTLKRMLIYLGGMVACLVDTLSGWFGWPNEAVFICTVYEHGVKKNPW